jgi:DNA-binding MarR family transcriptional regulator
VTIGTEMHQAQYETLLGRIAAMTAHPNFRPAAACYFREFHRTQVKNHALLKLASDEGRYALAVKIVAMLISSSETRKLTIGMLQSFAEEHRLCSRNRVTMIINVAELFGYLHRIKDAKDRRSRTIVATEKFQRMFDDGFRYFSLPLALIDPQKSRLIPLADRALCADFVAEAIDLYLGEMRFGELLPELRAFIHRDGALEIMARLMIEARYFTPEQRTIVDLPYARLAGEMALSRSHVQKFFATLAERELVRLGRPGGREIEILPKGDLVAHQIAASFLCVFQIAAGTMLRRRGLLDATDDVAPAPLRESA